MFDRSGGNSNERVTSLGVARASAGARDTSSGDESSGGARDSEGGRTRREADGAVEEAAAVAGGGEVFAGGKWEARTEWTNSYCSFDWTRPPRSRRSRQTIPRTSTRASLRSCSQAKKRVKKAPVRPRPAEQWTMTGCAGCRCLKSAITFVSSTREFVQRGVV